MRQTLFINPSSTWQTLGREWDMQEWILIYDDRCEVCSMSASTLKKIDRSGIFQLTRLSDLDQIAQLSEAHQIPGLQDSASDELTLISTTGELFQGAPAIEKIIELLPVARPIRWLLERIRRRSVPAYSLMKSIRRRCKSCP